MKYINTTLSTIILSGFASIASADIINITTGTDSFNLYSNSNNALFDDASGDFSSTDLAAIHTTLNSWGIETDGMITILPMTTSAGLSLLTLVDQELGFGDTGIDASVSLSSTSPSSLGMYINDYDQDVWTLIDPPLWISDPRSFVCVGWGRKWRCICMDWSSSRRRAFIFVCRQWCCWNCAEC